MSSRVHEKKISAPFCSSLSPRLCSCERWYKEREGIKSIVLTISKSRFFFLFFPTQKKRFPSDARAMLFYIRSNGTQSPNIGWLHRTLCTIYNLNEFLSILRQFSASPSLLSHSLSLVNNTSAYGAVCLQRTLTKTPSDRKEKQVNK